jgi:hypothetical protein
MVVTIDCSLHTCKVRPDHRPDRRFGDRASGGLFREAMCFYGKMQAVDSRVESYPFALASIVYGVLLLRWTGAFNRTAESPPRWYPNLFVKRLCVHAAIGPEEPAFNYRFFGATVAIGPWPSSWTTVTPTVAS